MKSAITYFISFMVVATLAQAQDITKENMQWEVTQLKDLHSGESMEYQCTFNTYGAKRITWVQKGNYIIEFEVKRVSGKWKDIDALGTVVYNVSADGDEGTITFEKDRSGTTISMDLSQEANARLQHLFKVSNRKLIQ